jgi:hypothetical protein
MDAKEQALTSDSIVDNFIYQSDSLNWLFDKTATYVSVSTPFFLNCLASMQESSISDLLD